MKELITFLLLFAEGFCFFMAGYYFGKERNKKLLDEPILYNWENLSDTKYKNKDWKVPERTLDVPDEEEINNRYPIIDLMEDSIGQDCRREGARWAIKEIKKRNGR